MAAGKRECNLHAATLVLRLVAKQVGRIQQSVMGGGSGEAVGVKRVYAECSRMYVADQVLYIAMLAPKPDIYY